MKKKLLLLLVCSLTAVCGFAQNDAISGTCGDNLTWTLSGGTLTISGTGAMTNSSSSIYSGVLVPWSNYCSQITKVVIEDGVTSIGNYAFSGCSGLTSITIPSIVTYIGSGAFRNCSGLTSITIPGSVTSIGGYAFYGCNGLTSLTIPGSVTSIGGYAFYGCNGLTSVSIPNSVASIGGYAFYGCNGLTSVTIPNSVMYIGNNAFSGCSGLTSLTIPNRVTSIGNGAFSGCSGLTSIEVESTNKWYSSVDGVLFNKDVTTLFCFPAKKSGNYIIPNSVTSIGGYAFYGSGLTSIIIPNSVTSIGDYAFYGSGLTSIIIPNNVTYVGGEAFGYCSGLTSVTIFSSNTTMYNSPFYGCYSISSVSIPNISSPYSSALSSALRELSLTAITSISATTFKSSIFADITGLHLPNTLISIDAASLSNCSKLKELTLPFIGTSPTTPTSLSTLFGGSMPATLQKLTLVRSASNIQIADNALSGLSSLTELTLSSNVRGLGENALYGCINLKHIYSQWASPPTAYNNSTFQGVNKYACTIHIPTGSRNDYSTADGWKEFFNFEEEAAITIVALFHCHFMVVL